MARSVHIIGLGLIGGSAGMALRSRGWRVTYADPEVSQEEARSAGAADQRSDDCDSDVILIATPVETATQLLPAIRTNGVITSACSVMRALRDAQRPDQRFIAGHPMAGSQDRGLAAARADLFESKPWFVDADDETVDALIRDCGAQREHADAGEHDAAVALTSHLPQILSTALAAHLADHPEIIRYAGSGLRTFLRLAGSDAAVWTGVLAANRDNIAPHAEAVAQLAREIASGDRTAAFERAQKLWRTL